MSNGNIRWCERSENESRKKTTSFSSYSIARYKNGAAYVGCDCFRNMKSVIVVTRSNLAEKTSTCTVENPHIINSIYFRSIIKENDFNGKD